MKALRFMIAALLLMGSTCVWADDANLEDMTDKEVSAHFQQKIDELNAEIKLINTKLKADKENVDLHKNLVQCKNDLATFKSKKKIVDNSIKTRAKADAAIVKAEKAIQKAEQLKQKAKDMAKMAETAAREALKVRQ